MPSDIGKNIKTDDLINISETFMALTRNFKQTILERAQRDSTFRKALLVEAVNELLAGDLETGKAMLRDYINATVSFEPLAQKLDKNSKSLQRMLSPNGNPTSKSLFSMLHVLQDRENIQLRVQPL
jgi:DNA-binding phage protein